MTLRLRLTAWYVLLVAATLTVFSLLVYFGLSRTLHRQFDVALETEMQDQLSALRETGALGRVRQEDRPPPGIAVGFFGIDGRLLSGDGVFVSGMPHLFSRGEWRYCTVPVSGRGFVQVYGSEHSLEHSLSQLAWLLILAVPLTSLATGAGGLFLASRALRPIDRITQTAADLGADDLSRRLPSSPVRDEVGRLSATFNAMLERLEGSFQKQRQFTSDAAHELRTPLALMLGRAELTLDRERSPEEYRAALREVQAETARLSRLVAKLLTLARADAGTLGLELESLDWLQLATDVAEVLQPVAVARGVELVVEGSPCPVRGDQTRLTELVLNLVDNALKAGGARVVLRAGPALEVVDEGCGIALEHQQRIFERFYQVDATRSGDASGLGLAISRAIVEEHGGRLTVHSAPGKGSTFRVELP